MTVNYCPPKASIRRKRPTVTLALMSTSTIPAESTLTDERQSGKPATIGFRRCFMTAKSRPNLIFSELVSKTPFPGSVPESVHHLRGSEYGSWPASLSWAQILVAALTAKHLQRQA
jgi:hypothetical protein